MICYAVIDTNVLVSALLSGKDDAAAVQVLGKVLRGEIIPVYSIANRVRNGNRKRISGSAVKKEIRVLWRDIQSFEDRYFRDEMFLSFSGGKDSTVTSDLVARAFASNMGMYCWQTNQYPWIILCHGSLLRMMSFGICILRPRKLTAVRIFLPSRAQYFEPLGNMEYRAYEMRQQYPQIRKEFETCSLYHLNNQEIRNQLYGVDLSRVQFIERLAKVIEPVYESARNCGFREWVYHIKESD